MKTLSFTVDRLIYCDLSQILKIEAASFEYPWSREDFVRVLNLRDARGHVARCPGGSIVGFVIYQFTAADIIVLNLAVHPDFRRLGVGSQLMARLGKRMKVDRPHIFANVSDKNLVGHLFLRSLGFKAVQVLRGEYEGGADAYRFQFTRRNC